MSTFCQRISTLIIFLKVEQQMLAKGKAQKGIQHNHSSKKTSQAQQLEFSSLPSKENLYYPFTNYRWV